VHDHEACFGIGGCLVEPQRVMGACVAQPHQRRSAKTWRLDARKRWRARFRRAPGECVQWLVALSLQPGIPRALHAREPAHKPPEHPAVSSRKALKIFHLPHPPTLAMASLQAVNSRDGLLQSQQPRLPLLAGVSIGMFGIPMVRRTGRHGRAVTDTLLLPTGVWGAGCDVQGLLQTRIPLC
jgi:hypothetical protein